MTLEVLSKRCTRCGETKSASEFYRHKRSGDGYHSWCKVCHKASTEAAQARRRAEMGEEAWLAHQRSVVARSRQKRGLESDYIYAKARREAVAALINRHRPEFDHLFLLARRGELDQTG